MEKIVTEQKSIKSNNVFLLLFVIVIVFVQLPTSATRPVHQAGRRRLIIHVPMQVKVHHHTHTVYSRIRSGETKQTVYKILGFVAHGADDIEGESERGNTWQHPHDDSLDYEEQVHRFSRGRNHKTQESIRTAGDMIFNHYSRKDDESVDYPEIEAYVDEIHWEQ